MRLSLSILVLALLVIIKNGFSQEKLTNLFTTPDYTIKLNNGNEIKAITMEDTKPYTAVSLINNNDSFSTQQLAKFGMPLNYLNHEGFAYLQHENEDFFLIYYGLFTNKVSGSSCYQKHEKIADFGSWALFRNNGDRIIYWSNNNFIHLTKNENPNKIVAYLTSKSRDTLLINHLNNVAEGIPVSIDLSVFTDWAKIKNLQYEKNEIHASNFLEFKYNGDYLELYLYDIDLRVKCKLAQIFLGEELKLEDI